MYQRLLGLALDETSDGDGLTSSEALGQLLSCRRQLRHEDDNSDGRDDSTGGTASGLGEELAYDLALLRLARMLGIPVDVRAFGQPNVARSRLEQAVEAYGIRLAEPDT